MLTDYSTLSSCLHLQHLIELLQIRLILAEIQLKSNFKMLSIGPLLIEECLRLVTYTQTNENLKLRCSIHINTIRCVNIIHKCNKFLEHGVIQSFVKSLKSFWDLGTHEPTTTWKTDMPCIAKFYKHRVIQNIFKRLKIFWDLGYDWNTWAATNASLELCSPMIYVNIKRFLSIGKRTIFEKVEKYLCIGARYEQINVDLELSGPIQMYKFLKRLKAFWGLRHEGIRYPQSRSELIAPIYINISFITSGSALFFIKLNSLCILGHREGGGGAHYSLDTKRSNIYEHYNFL